MKLTENEIQLLTELNEKISRIYGCLGRTFFKCFNEDGEEERTDLFDLHDDLFILTEWFANQPKQSLSSLYSKVGTNDENLHDFQPRKQSTHPLSRFKRVVFFRSPLPMNTSLKQVHNLCYVGFQLNSH